MNIKDKVVVITGGTQGIGASVAMELAKQGAKLCLVSRKTNECKIRELIVETGAPLLLIDADIKHESECNRIIAETVNHFGRIDVLIHSAGAAAPGGLLNGARDVWHEAFDVHLHAAFYLCSAVVPHIKKQSEGAIILISSAAGMRGVKNALAYAVVKGAIPQFTRALAFELGDFNIRVNCVSPGVIRTRFQDFLSAEQAKNNIDNRIPLHREGTPEDVAEVITMLIKNEFITGENIVIDGGMTMRIV